jgi:RNA polymerase sigma-70 factor (ECF subfamily)
MNREDQSIIQKVQEGNKEGLRILFDRYYKRLYLFALSLLEDQFMAEDVVQDIFIHMWENGRKLEINGSLSSYLFGAVHHRSIHYLRKMKTRERHRQREMMKLREAEILAMHSNDFSFSELESEEIRKVIGRVFDSLPQKTQVIFRLSRSGLMTNAEIAKHMKLHVKTVEYHISRALKAFHKALAPYFR